MPIQTDTSASPYNDDFDASKDYYKILFRPGVAVQVRELNQLQTLLQKQIERFGDNIYKRGTIVDGCTFDFESAIHYVKLLDVTSDSTVANVSSYVGLSLNKENTQHKSYVLHSEDGFEARDPDLKTLYLKYKNSSDDNATATYSAGDTLTVYNEDYNLYSISTVNASSGFSNTDNVVILSSVALQNSTGGTDFGATFQIGEIVTQTTTGAQGVVVSSNTTANTSAVVLQIKPESADLATQNTSGWAFGEGNEITGGTSTARANVVNLVGSGASATITTTGGDDRIGSITVIEQGSGYYVPPTATISSTTATTGELDILDLDARNYLTKVTVSSTTNAVGVGYGMHITSGVIYQKGYFERVEPQFEIVSKYSNTVSDTVIGFSTVETIVNSNSDSSLLDNSSDTLNQNAPGANRLKLVPTLTTKTTAEADADEEFFPLVEFSEGKPYRQNRFTQYNKLNDEMARRTSEESGNYVLDPFLVATRSSNTFEDSNTAFDVIVDPGHAYINGYRVETQRNYTTSVDKAKNTRTVTATNIDLSYGNYVKVSGLSGSWDFTKGEQVSLRDTASDYYDTNPGATISAGAGNEIGKARIRSVVYESGEPGDVAAVYRLYIFDVLMDAGKNFRDVKSFYFDNGSTDAVADCILELDGTTNSNVAVIKEPEKDGLIFGSDKIKAIQTASNLSYTYKTISNTSVIAAGGTVEVTNAASTVWPYAGSLSTTEQQDLIVIPVSNVVATAGITGTGDGNGNTIAGTTTAFITDLNVGDYITIDSNITRVVAINSDTEIEVEPDVTTAGGQTMYLTFPANIPVPLSTRTNRTASVSGSTLTIDLDITISGPVEVDVIHNLTISGASPVAKSTDRKNYVKIQANTATNGVSGPWGLGQSDIFRLRGVYAGSTTSDTDITKHFYIDHNQNENYYDIGQLHLRPTSNYTIGADDILLVEFDLNTQAIEGLKTIDSFTITDGETLTDLDANESWGVNTLEIPEVYTSRGDYYDLRDSFDFRPVTSNTAVRSTTAGGAPTNPAAVTESSRFSTDDKKFPVPESDLTLTYSYYEPRTDTVLVKSSGDIQVLTDEKRQPGNKDEIILNYLDIPAYPSLPEFYSTDLTDILDKNIANEKYSNQREELYKISNTRVNSQPRGYTMDQIGKLERRIEALEYYSRLSVIEQELKDKVIPSEVTPTIDRYKFGFFVDDFRSEQFSDLDSPEYTASIFENRLYPKQGQMSIKYKLANTDGNALIDNGTNVTLPNQSNIIVSQKNATDGSPSSNTVTAESNNYSTQCVNINNRNNSYYKPSGSPGNVFEENVFTLTANTDANGAEVVLYFNAYTQKDRFEVYQSSNAESFTDAAVVTSETSSVLTQAEKNEIANLNVNGDWTKLPDRVLTGSDYWVEKGIGKLTFNYNIANGKYIMVRVVKGSPIHFYRICFPASDLGTPATSTYLKPVVKTRPVPLISIYNQVKTIPNPVTPIGAIPATAILDAINMALAVQNRTSPF